MSGEIVKHQAAPVAAHGGGALSLAAMSAQEAWRFSEALASANLLPPEYRNNPGSVLWAMEYGRALGLDVVTTITTIHVIKGKPTQSADLMLSRAREAGHRVRITSERERCVVRIVRHDDPEDENVVEWTLADARQAQLYPGKPDSNWAKYPRAMLRARAIAECVRIACPEVLHGAIYTPEELGARVNADGEPVDAEVTQLRRVQPGEGDPWATPAPSEQKVTPPEQKAAEDAAHTRDPDTVREIYRQAKAAGLLTATAITTLGSMELGEYLVARGQQLTEPSADGEAVEDVDANLTPYRGEHGYPEGESPEEQARASEAELRAYAAEIGLDQIDRDFESATGLPLAEAGPGAIREFLNQLRGTAA